MTPGQQRWASVALAASVVIFALAASAPETPVRPVTPPDYAALAPMVAVSTALGLGSAAEEVKSGLLLISLLGYTVTFLLLLKQARLGRVTPAAALGSAIVLQLFTLSLPLLVSRDVYSYGIYGRIASVYHENPYISAPARFPDDPLFPFVARKWIETPPVYGPVYTTIVAFVARFATSPSLIVVAFKALAVLVSVVTLGVLARHLRRVEPGSVAFAVLLFGVAPAAVVHAVASGHNDLLVALSITAALAFLGRDREYLATLALALGTLVKMAAALPLALLLVTAVARRPPGARAGVALRHLVVAVLATAVFVVPYFQLQDPTFGLLELAGHTTWLGPSGLLAEGAASVVSHAGAGGAASVLASKAVRSLFFLVFLAAFAATLLVTARRRDLGAKAQGAAWGFALLLLTLTGPVLQPWYIVWTLPVAYALPEAPRAALVVVTALLGLSVLIAEPLRHQGIFGGILDSTHWVVTAGCAWALVHVLRGLRAWLRDEPAVTDARAA